jgi:hypothetical protein
MARGGVVIRGATSRAYELTGPGTSGQVLTSNGSGADPTFQNVTAFFLRSIVSLTNAQIIALPTTGITLVSAPGSGLIVRPFIVSLRSSFAAGAYTNVNAAADLTALLGTQYVMSSMANDAAITNVGAGTTMLTSFLGANIQYAQLVPWNHTENVNEWGELTVRKTLSAVENQALTLKVSNGGSGNFTGGNAANTLLVTTYYALEAV